jgi:hypothetical protein
VLINKIITEKEEYKMSISHERIIEACKPILEEVGFHDAKTRHPRRFITAYQIWLELKRAQDHICNELIEACKGEYVGKNAGSNIGPAQKIAQALGNSPDIETQYITTKYLHFDEIRASDGDDCGLFRLKE